MLTRKCLEDLFHDLPAILVMRANASAEEAQHIADTCLLEEWKHANRLDLYVVVGGVSFKLTYDTNSAMSYRLERVARLNVVDRHPQWEMVSLVA